MKTSPEDVPMDLRAPETSTHSMLLTWSRPNKLNPVSYKISYDATKEFFDSQGRLFNHTVSRRVIYVDHTKLSKDIPDLMPFTTYNVNVSAVPLDESYRPPAKITVTTQMAAPKPMVKPDFYGVVNGEEIHVILPQASEEYGPISHYYLVVVPESMDYEFKDPDEITDNMIMEKNSKDVRPDRPYITAKFKHRDIPYTFLLGDGATYDVYENKKLEKNKRYRIFVRAIVDTPRKVSKRVSMYLLFNRINDSNKLLILASLHVFSVLGVSVARYEGNPTW